MGVSPLLLFHHDRGSNMGELSVVQVMGLGGSGRAWAIKARSGHAEAGFGLPAAWGDLLVV
jgi:hypothetical protein